MTCFQLQTTVQVCGRRPEGIPELGYLQNVTQGELGAFGLGAKAALSMGFYTIETIHNGKRFKCNCYNYKTDFIIPAFNVKMANRTIYYIYRWH